jgi:CBS domain-containing protein
MSVARILAAKGRHVVTTQPHRTLREVAGLLTDHGIGAVVVANEDGGVLGIISERDIVRAVAEGANALEDQVSRHMTPNVVTVRESDSIDSIMDTMTTGRFRHAPVIEQGRLCGIVSIGDVVKHRVAAIETEKEALREYIASA